MDRSRRLVLALLIAAIVLFLGMLFWPFVLNSLIKPAALVLWLLLRILVLSIHQKYFWYAVIFAAIVVLFRLLRQAPADTPSDPSPETSSTIANIGYWRGLFIYNGQNALEDQTLKRQLRQLLTSLYALKQGTPNTFRIYDALQQGTIPLPETIHTFLFPQESPAAGGRLRTFFQSLRATPRKWIRHWTGQEKIEHTQMIEAVLDFLETSLEINNDDKKRSSN